MRSRVYIFENWIHLKIATSQSQLLQIAKDPNFFARLPDSLTLNCHTPKASPQSIMVQEGINTRAFQQVQSQEGSFVFLLKVVGGFLRRAQSGSPRLPHRERCTSHDRIPSNAFHHWMFPPLRPTRSHSYYFFSNPCTIKDLLQMTKQHERFCTFLIQKLRIFHSISPPYDYQKGERLSLVRIDFLIYQFEIV